MNMDIKTKTKIYQIGRNLGVKQSEIDEIIKDRTKVASQELADSALGASQNPSNLSCYDDYKTSGGKYGSVSPVDFYKDPTGGMYGTISPKDF